MYAEGDGSKNKQLSGDLKVYSYLVDQIEGRKRAWEESQVLCVAWGMQEEGQGCEGDDSSPAGCWICVSSSGPVRLVTQ